MKDSDLTQEVLRRRGFLARLLLGGATLLWAACSSPLARLFQDGGSVDEDGGPLDGGVDLDGGPADGGPDAGDDAGTDAGTADAGDGGADGGPTPSCDETLDNILGPFYVAGAPSKTTLRETGMVGTPFAVSGQVLGFPDCKPLTNATLDVWQADNSGNYDSVGYRLRGVFAVDASGGYVLTTIIPGHYLNGSQYRPAHIHVIVRAPGFKDLTTQLYFAGDQYNSIDPWWKQKLTMALADDGSGGKQSTFNFVIQPN
jgi:protocatechuate 3,4-dioxygenase beta subunit